MKGRGFYLAVALLVAIAISVLALGGGTSQCRETREFRASDYWFWEGYLGVTNLDDVESRRVGQLSHRPQICFTILSSELTSDLERTKGYRRAIAEWLKFVPLDPTRWNTPKVLAARSQLARITGIEFSTREELTDWWVENGDYLRWSEADEHLVVVESAKANRTPVVEERTDISARVYWYLSARGWLENEQEHGEFRTAKAWIPPEGHRTVRVEKDALRDHSAKQEGYRDAVKQLIIDGLAIPNISPEGAHELMSRLRAITRETYNGREQWVRWWQEHKENLVLPKGQDRLMVSGSSE